MGDLLNRVWSQGRELWGRLPVWFKLAGAVAVLALLLYGGFAVPGRTADNYVALPGQPFEAADLPAVLQKLQEMNVPTRAGGLDGTAILVPRDQLMQGRLAVAQAGVPKQPVGYELFDKTNLTQTEFDKQVQRLRAMQGQLEQTLGALAPIKSAKVHIAIPERSVFLREQKPVRVGVMLEPRPGQKLNPRDMDGIVRFVAAAVPELDSENVFVIDNTGKLLAQGLAKPDPATAAAAATGEQLQAQMAYQIQLEQTLQGALDRIYGPGNATTMVSVRFNNDQRQEERTTFSGGGANGQPLVRSSQSTRESFSGTGAPPAQPAAPQGTDANTPSPPTYQVGGQGGATQSSYDKSTQIINNELNQIKTTEITPPGRIEDVSVGVFINEKLLTGGTAQVQTIQTAVARAVGARVENVSVAPLAFNNDVLKLFQPPDEPRPAPAPAGVPWQTVAAIGFGVLAAVFLALFLATALRRRGTLVPEPVPALAGGPGVDLETLAAARAADEEAQFPAAAQMAPAAPAPPDTSGVDLTHLLGEEIVQKMQATDPVRQKLREEIERMVRQNPDLVAQLIRAWLGTEERS